MRIFISLFVFTFLCFACGKRTKTTPVDLQKEIPGEVLDPHNTDPQAAIFCWCLEVSGKNTPHCSTLVAVKPSELVDSSNLTWTSVNLSDVKKLMGWVTDSSRIQIEGSGMDTRFVMIFKTDPDRNADTLAKGYSDIYYLNGQLFRYPFNLMDSILYLTKKDSLNCPRN